MYQPQPCDEPQPKLDIEEVKRKVQAAEPLTDAEAALLGSYMFDNLLAENHALKAELHQTKKAMVEFCRVIAYIAVATMGKEPSPGVRSLITVTKQEWQSFFQRFDAKVDVGSDPAFGDHVVQVTLLPKPDSPQIIEATPAQQQAVAQRKLVIP